MEIRGNVRLISKRKLSMIAGFTGVLLLGATARAADTSAVRFIGKTKYLNNAHAVVAHTIDDSTKYVTNCIDAMDQYGIKATIFVSTEQDPAPEDRFFTQLQVWNLWPRLRQAVDSGHEIGSHSRTHPCGRPDNEAFCSAAYTDYEVTGSRDDILRRTRQPYVWTWCYPCGHCADHDFIQKKIAAAGYIVARNYPGEAQDRHIRPDLQTWDSNPYNAAYTQVVQKRGGAAKSEIIDVAVLDAKFDEVYQRGGIYNFMSHPQWLDYGPEGFYERHLAHISRRRDVWYVPMGPLYAYHTIFERTEVRPLSSGAAKASFAVSNKLDPKIYNGSITLEFRAPAGMAILSNGRRLAERTNEMTDRWNQEYLRRDGDHLYVTVLPNTTLEFLVLSSAAGSAADVAGVWKASYTTADGQTRETTLNLKVDGDKVTGTIASPHGSAGIADGKVSGDDISFTVIRRGNGDEIRIHYAGKIEGETMKLRMQIGDRDPIPVTAKRGS